MIALALIGALLRWVVIRRRVGRVTAAAVTAVIWLVALAIARSSGGDPELVYLALGALSLYVFLVMPTTDSAGFPTNALLAEHSLSLIELVPENSFARSLNDAIVAVYQNAGFRSLAFEDVVRRFNGETRLVQLNIVAVALKELGHPPILSGAEWIPVINPLVAKADQGQIDHVSRWLNEKFNTSLQIKDGKLQMTEVCLTDRGGQTVDRSRDDRIGFLPPPFHCSKVMRSYQLGDCTGLLLTECGSMPPIEYVHALAVVPTGKRKASFIVTAERNAMQGALQEIASELVDVDFDTLGNSLVLGALVGEGHENYGPIDELGDIQIFANHAVKVAKEKLGL